ncbi:MAG: hypothetical protein WAT23_13790 [Chromatiaceae bacterium]
MKSAITDLPLIGDRPMTPEEEIRFWRYFYTESQRIFGDRQGTLESLTNKAMNLLRYDSLFVAEHGMPTYDLDGEGRREEFRAGFDERKKKEWRKRYVPVYLESAYDVYTSPAGHGMSKNEAIRAIAREYRFPSFEAAYKELQRIGIKGLPSTWPK